MILLKIKTTLKMIYLYLLYFLVGLSQEDFYVSKANYFADLGYYNSAIKYYKKALSIIKMPTIYSMIGWCYLQQDIFEQASEYYSKAYEKLKTPLIVIGYAISEFELGNYNMSENLCKELNDQSSNLPKQVLVSLEELQEKLNARKVAD
jgi:tetratricopeptide (TPR) repeat protein